MKYFNKTRTIEQKVTDREVLLNLSQQTELLKAILEELKRMNTKKTPFNNGVFFVIAIGFEPMTVCLEGRCSIQLSYATLCRLLIKPFDS